MPVLRSNKLRNDTILLLCMGRCLYNKYVDGAPEELNQNLLGNRVFSVQLSSVVQAISYIRTAHSRILEQKEVLSNSADETHISSFGFTLSVTFNSSNTLVFQTNHISISFSKNEKMILHVPTLKSYSAMDYSCFSGINPQQIQEVVKGNFDTVDSQNVKAKFIQITSLFLCETIRNAEALITIPMCLEIAYIVQKTTSEKRDQLFFYSKKSIDQLGYYTKEAKEKLLEKYDYDKNQDFTEYEICVGHMLKYMFPMSAAGAVSGSRYLHGQFADKIDASGNEENAQLKQKYDNETGGIKEAKALVYRERTLVECYNYFTKDKDQYNLAQITERWYDETLNPNDVVLSIVGDIIEPFEPTPDS